jgi:hypothetical protein
MAERNKIADGLQVLGELGMPRAQQNDRSALCLLALLNLSQGESWAAGPLAHGQTHPTGYNRSVEKTARVFANFEDADEADARYDAAMSSEERLSILIELRDRRHPDASEQRLARVSRVIELERS